jgi:hypothetical protein
MLPVVRVAASVRKPDVLDTAVPVFPALPGIAITKLTAITIPDTLRDARFLLIEKPPYKPKQLDCRKNRFVGCV